MSEESQENYNSGDVVWVKLGSSWWPGEVKDIDELPNDILEFKKPPLVIVKFFDEDLYEYVRTWANIYPYNSEKKNEFIKKGMAAYRAKTPHMEKFPKDVLTAEARMGGNPNILSEPMFLPEKKRNYSAEMYGTPSPKNKSNKEKKRSSTSKPSSQKDTAHITHRRFLGVDDYRAYICIQYPGKDRIAGDREDDEVLRINREPEQEFNCHSCSFTTKRLEVMILHTKSHIQGVYVSSPRSAKHPAVRRKKESMKKPRNSDDMMDSDTSSSDSDYVREKKRKPKSQGARKMKTKKAEKPKEEPKTSNDIRTELLAVWDDSDEDEEFDLTPNRSTETDQSYSQSITDIILGKTPGGEKKLETSDDADKETTDADTTLDRTQDQPGTSRDVTGEVLNQKDKVIPDKPSEVGQETESKEDVLNESEVGKETVEDALVKDPSLSAGDSKEPTENSAKAKASKDKGLSKDASEDGDKSSHRMDRDIQEAIKSCFDFDEDEEDDGAVMGRTAAGRKIPRVIPPAERRKSQEMPEDDANREKSLDETEQSGGKEETETRSEDVDATFKELMEMTAVPELPDIHNTLKCEQNFHNIKTIKFPDKPDNTFDPFTPDAIGPSISDVAAASMSDAVETSKADDVDTSKLDVVDTPKLAVVDSPKSDVVDSPKSDVVDASKSDVVDASKLDVVDASKLDVVDTSIVDVVGPSKPDAVGPSKPEATGSSKPEKKEPSESATKLINPKKRFVKSFEDFELMQNEIRRKEEEAKPKTKKKKQQQAKSESTPIEQANPEEILKRAISDEPQEDYSPEDNIELSKLKSKIMSRIIEEANINDECRTKIMSKIQDSSKTKGDEQDVNSNEEVKTGSHRTPRSKILELYRNDTNKQRAEERREIEKMEEEHKNEKAEESANSKEDNAEDRLKERPTRSEAMPPKKGKWSRRGSHPKKDRNALLLTSLLMDDVPKQAEEDKKHEESVPVDNQTPLDAVDNLASKSKDEELKCVPTEEDEENTVVKHKLEVEESNKLLPTEEDIIKTSDELDAKEEIAATVSTEQVEEHSQSTDEQNDSTPIQEEVTEEIVAEEPSADNETEKTVTAQDSEVESLFPKESEFDCLKEKELDCLPQIEEVIEEEKIEALENDVTKPEEADAASERIEKIEIKNDVVKTEESDVASIDAQMGSSTEEKDITDAIQSNTMILPMDKSVVPPKEIFAEGVEVTLEEVVEETQQIEAEEPRLPSPIVDVMVPPSPVLPKEAICSPPKKSKKRKLSESLVAAAEARAPIPESDLENFCSAEKKKKETDHEGKEIKEPSPPAPDKPETELTTATVDKFREYKAKTNDMEVAKEAGAAVPTPEEVAEHNNEVEIQCGSSSPESFKFSIQTNLSNLTSREEISALALATLSEIKADLEASDSNMSEEKAQQAAVVPPAPAASELVGPIEGNLTVMSERDLADGQVEITTEQVISPKRPVMLSNFSMDFSDSASDSNNSTNDTIVDYVKCTEFGSGGTEFTSKAMTKQIKKVDRKRENAYERLELLNILEGNSDTERKPRKERLSQLQAKKSIVDDICDFEEHIPSQIVCAKNLKRDSDLDREYPYTEKVKTREKSTTSKLLERLTVTANKAEAKETLLGKLAKKNQMLTPKTIKINKYIGKAKPPPSITKPIILSEQIVKPATETAKAKHKKALDDIEDVEAFVIHKDPKRIQEHDALDAAQSTKAAGKAKILQQTIITPAGEIIQPTVGQAQTDDNIFDIDSMPIVLSDEILTPESIENMPIMIGSETKSAEPEKVRPAQSRIITAPTPAAVPQPVTTRNQILIKQSKTPRILQSVGSKMLKNSPMLSNATKPGKYIILPQSGVEAAKYVAKKGPVVKRTNIVPKSPAITPEPSGNKIMIVTNQQGQQQRLLLTPAQQKMLGYQNQKTTKTLVKGNVMQKSVLAAKSVEAGTSGVLSKSSSLIGQKVVVGTSPSTGLLATTSPQLVTSQGRIIKGVTKKVHPMNQKLFPGGTKTQKTILIKNQHGQTVRKIQGTDDELLDKQVAEQLEAIKASSGMKFSQQPKQIEPYKAKAQARRSYSKKPEPKPKLVPPLTSIQPPPKPEPPVTIATLPTPKKLEPVESKPTPTTIVAEEPKPPIDRPLNQLVIQDAVGNQTTITEGQILALPSETVDGQPQSYMLVTLDESGNLTPLNSEALMSLDPNLGLGGDLSNMVLQIDQGALGDRPQTIAVKATVSSEPPKLAIAEPPAPIPVPEASITTEIAETVVDAKSISEASQPIVPCTNGDPGQQLIVTGDPIATQKFLESLTEGTTDLANILANAEGNSILIQADGQQILINTNSDNQMLLSVNNDSLNASESTEGGGNPIFATQPSKNQDILAAALADTDVFQQEQHAAQSKITSQLSPSNALYPMNVSNVLETSLTLSSPIMTPLEIPTTNSKKIPDDEADILTQVPKNVDLPITITDPNISQTVANQQVALQIANELHTNLELGLPVSESVISSVSTCLNSPSYVYSLPALDESVDINQKPFNSSMPLLNEDIEEATAKPKGDDDDVEKAKEDASIIPKPQGELPSGNSFLDEEEGRFTLGGEMCSSLSEPPPEMFDLPEDNQNLLGKRNSNIPSSLQSTPDASDNASKDGDTTDLSTQAESSNDSCEIPLQPRIVAKSSDLSENLGSFKRNRHEAEEEEEEEENKRCKFD